jgi:probable HAF family extracellular repeat protein
LSGAADPLSASVSCLAARLALQPPSITTGKVVGVSGPGYPWDAVEWSGGAIKDLGGLPGSNLSYATALNDGGQAVGYSTIDFIQHAVEWSGGSIIDLGALPYPSNSNALAINDDGQVVGYIGGQAVEWSGGSIIDLSGLPGSSASAATAINNDGQVVGYSDVDGTQHAVEWNDGSVIDLDALPDSRTGESNAYSINNVGQVLGSSFGVPHPSTWALMLVGFAGLGYAGYRSRRSALAA